MTLTETEQKFNHDLKLLPKSHSLVHFTRDVRKVGPLYWMTVFKYEICNGIVRNYFHVNRCFMNVLFTMANKFQFHYANSLLSSAHESDEANVEACEDIIVGEHEFGEELQQQFNSLPTQLLCVADKLNFRHTSYRLLDVLGFSKSDDSYEFYFVVNFVHSNDR
uniref:Uncharacterized protein n=1 Tax=Plectus sambesii TaxID=2011161 RepID=A0A914V7I2_9BILA